MINLYVIIVVIMLITIGAIVLFCVLQSTSVQPPFGVSEKGTLKKGATLAGNPRHCSACFQTPGRSNATDVQLVSHVF